MEKALIIKGGRLHKVVDCPTLEAKYRALALANYPSDVEVHVNYSSDDLLDDMVHDAMGRMEGVFARYTGMNLTEGEKEQLNNLLFKLFGPAVKQVWAS